jgi:hypothetical protein
MKMVKSALLGCAAGIVAVGGAQAANLPVKAKAVEYVKVCSLYGAGYYYMPGTDICIKIGGYVRYQHNWGTTVGGGTQPFTDTDSRRTRTDNDGHFMRARFIVSVDTRQQTAYGTLRTYLTHGATVDSSAPMEIYSRRAFIQIAGFTFGRATSFFDLFSTASYAYNAGSIHSSDTGDAGQTVAAYTAQLGNGVSASVSMEANKHTAHIINTSVANSLAILAAPTSNTRLAAFPDLVGNLRIDQAWGTAQVAGVIVDASGGYYGTTLTGSEVNGHPSDKLGWGAMAGLNLNLPFIAPGDRLSLSGIYTEGAPRYATNNASSDLATFDGNSVAFGWITQGVFSGTTAVTGSEVHLTTVWSASAGFEHMWTPALRTSLYGSYVDVSYNASATAAICAMAGTNPDFAAGCNPSFSIWSVGSRTQWEPTKGLYMGVDVMYQQLNSSRSEALALAALGTNGAKPAGTYTVDDLGHWYVTFRVHRDFLP